MSLVCGPRKEESVVVRKEREMNKSRGEKHWEKCQWLVRMGEEEKSGE